MKVVITAAGKGTRLRPVTNAIPKVMLPLVNKPTLQYIVEEVAASGIEKEDTIIVISKGQKMIRDFFGDRYVYVEQPEQVGLGDAVLCTRDAIGNEPFAVLYGDGPVVDADPPRLKQLIDVHNKYKGAPVIAAKMVPDHMVSKYGIIDYENVKGEKNVKLVKRIVEKPKPEDVESRMAVSAGCILTPDIFDILAKLKPGVGGEIQLADAQNELARRKKVYAVLYNGERLDVGNELSYAQATVEMALREVKGFEEWLEQRHDQ